MVCWYYPALCQWTFYYHKVSDFYTNQYNRQNQGHSHCAVSYTHLGFATYNKVTGEPLESGQISEKNLPPDGRNAIPAARNWYLFALSDDDRKVIQQESVKILENIPQAGIGRDVYKRQTPNREESL